MNTKLTSERIKKLREGAGYSHERLALALKEKYGISITPASLKKYEVSDQFHVNYGSVEGMATKYLYMFADFYGVSSDYILGKSKVKNPDPNIKAACELTGLSENAVVTLKDSKTITMEFGLISALLGHPGLCNLLSATMGYIRTVLGACDEDEISFCNKRNLDVVELKRYYMQTVYSNIIEDIKTNNVGIEIETEKLSDSNYLDKIKFTLKTTKESEPNA